MADQTHLERMGRELKCPICLSLLNSAVSLPCNHVFCNSCVVKSMKLGSDCPVCKLPYRRREVHPAPHMDNLVSIYKSMEAASGINIFVTQNAPAINITDGEHCSEAANNNEEENAHRLCLDKSENKTPLNQSGRKKRNISNLKSSDPCGAKLSFPTKKRVRLPTPLQPVKSHGESEVNTKERPQNSSLVLNEKGELVLSPFFWLREEDDTEKKSSQDTDGDHVMDTPPPNFPSFSDIMDSDDENPSNEGAPGKSNLNDYFDSEMFEWTQRPCSPELCASPMKIKVSDGDEPYEIQQRKIVKALQVTNTNEECKNETTEFLNYERRDAIVDLQPSKPSLRSRYDNADTESNKSNKRGQKSMKEVQSNSDESSADLANEQTCCIDSYFNVDKTNKTGKRSCVHHGVSKQTPQNVSSVSVGAEDLTCETRVNTDSELLSKKGVNGGVYTSRTEKNCNKTNIPKTSGFSLRSIKRMQKTVSDVFDEISIFKKQRDEDAINCIEKSTCDSSGIGLKCTRKLRCKKGLKAPTNCAPIDVFTDENQEGYINVSSKETEPHVQQFQRNCDVRAMDDTSTIEKLSPFMRKGALQKCKSVPDPFLCAFCHSSEISEGSGEMLHYNNGTPVAEDFSNGSKVIHSHKNCTEWAPNVYFEDDNAINLEAELARSRRIKCCCCDNKGAALGCYEKTCRRSFHIPCAKMIQQCRWDTDNFVMLCPLHASCKLPNEISSSQDKRKKLTAKGQTYTKCVQHVKVDESSKGVKWNSGGSMKKLVICCSAFSVADKETISDFERLSGATVLKIWDSSVTHVIASTDENGACRRTLKILMGILQGKWILSIEWIEACIKALGHVNEEPYEIHVDVHGIRDGPLLGRLRIMNKQPKLFDGTSFYFAGDFIPSYKGYLQDLVIAAGGTVLHRKPISRDREAYISSSYSSPVYIIYSIELPDKCGPTKKAMVLKSRLSDAEALANSTGARVASNTWVVNSIAACKLQTFSAM